jgi:excisionase family DNA binding protein
MTAKIRKSHKRTRAVRNAAHCSSTPLHSRASNTTAPALNGGNRGRPLTKLRTIAETAEVLNLSPRTVRRLIDSGALPVHRFGRLVRIAEGDIAAQIATFKPVHCWQLYD